MFVLWVFDLGKHIASSVLGVRLVEAWQQTAQNSSVR